MRALPFQLTESQKKVVGELLHDMQEPYAMNRLLQGDVGAGKTIVAAIGLVRDGEGGLPRRADGADGDSGRAA